MSALSERGNYILAQFKSACEYMTIERGITSMPTMSVNIRLNISELHECNFHY
jgi:hypothetical protein